MAGVAREKPLGPVYFRGEVGAARCICIDNACPRGEMLFIARPLSRPASTREEYHKSWRHRIAWPDRNKTIRVTLSSLPYPSSSPPMNSSPLVLLSRHRCEMDERIDSNFKV